jgi:hypothetical protein
MKDTMSKLVNGQKAIFNIPSKVVKDGADLIPTVQTAS